MNRWSSNYCWNSVNYTLRSMVTSMHQSIIRTSNDQVLWLWHHSISLDHKIFMLQFPLFHAVDRQTGPHLSSISINPNPSFLPCFLIIPSFPCNHYWQDVVAQFSLLFDLLCNYYSAWVLQIPPDHIYIMSANHHICYCKTRRFSKLDYSSLCTNSHSVKCSIPSNLYENPANFSRTCFMDWTIEICWGAFIMIDRMLYLE